MSTSHPSSAEHLPTPRQLLTSLLTAISNIPPPQPPTTSDNPTTTTTDGLVGSSKTRISTPSTNPLKHMPPSHKPLFTTLHVLFPSLLLPAFDLLDRGLVTRLQLSSAKKQETPQLPAPSSAVYVVRSAATATNSRRAAAAAAGDSSSTSDTSPRRYMVHTAPWNCTCAAFAFAAFPRGGDESGMLSGADTELDGGSGEERGWEFGGMSFDGAAAGDGGGRADVPPCCKHLLACVLADRWTVGLGGYVNERVVSREEMAGIFADI